MVDRDKIHGCFQFTLLSAKSIFPVRVECYVLKKSVTFDRIVDIRFRILVQVDNLCVASTFEVEYSVVIPAVLVITDQKTLRVCGKSSLTGTGKTRR